METTRFIRLLAACAVLALVACGSDDKATTPAPSPVDPAQDAERTVRELLQALTQGDRQTICRLFTESYVATTWGDLEKCVAADEGGLPSSGQAAS